MADIIYLFLGQTAQNQLVIRLQGHPVQALQLAHRLAELVFGSASYQTGTGQKWRFHKIAYYPPDQTDLASNGILEVIFKKYPR